MPLFETQRRVEFRDTDAAGIVHFSVFFAYMEQAEHEFLRSIGLGVVQKFGDQVVSWPRVNAVCSYRKPAQFEDLLAVQVSVQRIGDKSVTYDFKFMRGEDLIAEGQIVAACCEVEQRQLKSAVPIPAEFSRKLRPFLNADRA